MTAPTLHVQTLAQTPHHNELAQLILAYAAELAARRAELLANRATYARKLAELAAFDPLDTTRLTGLYREHVRQIDVLLDEFSADDEAPHQTH
jgi:hypothetical protein